MNRLKRELVEKSEELWISVGNKNQFLQILNYFDDAFLYAPHEKINKLVKEPEMWQQLDHQHVVILAWALIQSC